MDAVQLIQSADFDGVRLDLTPEGKLHYSGYPALIAEWLPILRENKNAIVAELHRERRHAKVVAMLGSRKYAVLVEDDHAIEDGVTLTPTPGQTPGHLCLHLASGGRQAVMSGDLMHHALQCAEPDWSTCFCTAPAEAAQTRRAFLERHAETDTLIMPAHFPTPTAGRIVRAGAAWRFAFDTGT